MNPALAARLNRRHGLRTDFAQQDGRIVIAQTQDCTPIAELAAQMRQAGMVGSSEMRHAAKIPDVVINAYINTHGVTYAEVMRDPIHFKRMLNDPANAAFRIWRGRV